MATSIASALSNAATLVVKENGALVVSQFPERSVADPLPFGDQFRQNDGHSYGLSLNIPIFNGLSTKNNIKRRKLNLKRSENQFEQSTLTRPVRPN